MNYKTQQPYVELEHQLQELFGCPHVVVCSSGTTALYLAYETIKQVAGMDTTVRPCSASFPDFCMPAVWLMLQQTGFTDLNPCPVGFLGLTRRTCNKAVDIHVNVHTYGRVSKVVPAPYPCKNYVVEDLAECPLAPLSPTSTAFCWSFYKNKLIAGEEGGAVGFWSEELADRARQLRSLGLNSDYTYLPGGINARLSNANASLILEDIELVEAKQEIAEDCIDIYRDILPKEWTNNTETHPRDCPWVYDFDVPTDSRKQLLEFVAALNLIGIEARPSFVPYRVLNADKPSLTSVAISKMRMYLPFYYGNRCFGKPDYAYCCNQAKETAKATLETWDKLFG